MASPLDCKLASEHVDVPNWCGCFN